VHYAKKIFSQILSSISFVAAAAFFWGGSEALLNRFFPPRHTWQPDRLLESAFGREVFYGTVLLLAVVVAGAVTAVRRWTKRGPPEEARGRWRGAAAAAAVVASSGGWFVISRTDRGILNLGLIQPDLSKAIPFFVFWAAFALLGVGLALLIGRYLTRRRWWRRVAPYALAAGTAGFVAVAAARYVERELRPVPSGPNVVLVILDAWRHDAFCERLTPNLCAYATERGQVYTRAWAPASWTVPSMGSIFTGQFHDTHRARSGPLAGDDSPTIAQAFRAAGYDTAAAVGNPLVNRYHKVTDGFDNFVYWQWSPLLRATCFYYTNWYGPAVRGLIQRELGPEVSPRLTVLFGRYIARERRRPYFLWVHYMDPHGPYRPPPAYLLPRDKTPKGRKFSPREKRVRGRHRRYKSECRYVDDLLGYMVLPTLAASRDTVVVITGDHGEEFLEHGYLDHGKTVYETVARVPLIIAIPGEEAAVSDTPISLVDLGPTLLDVVGLPLLPTMQGQPLPRPSGEAQLRPIFIGSPFTGTRTRKPLPRKDAIVVWPHKLILEHKGMRKPGEYYHLGLDPHETHPLPEDETASRLRSRLGEWKRTTGWREMPDLSPMDTAAPADLRALGYIR
jgi:arylsulfatase A-like enzyme